MRQAGLLISFVLAVSLVGGIYWPAGAATLSSLPLSPAAPQANLFGYTATSSSSDTYAWIDATDGIKLFGLGEDDNTYPDAVPVGFSFPFFAASYSQVYVNMNGVVSFNNLLGITTELVTNTEIPFDHETPQNFLAPYWDDLHTYGVLDANAGVYAKQGPGNSYFVIEWYRVLSFQSSGTVDETISFEMVIYPDGNILFQYQELGATFQTGTVGIEDAYGLDGEQVLYNSPVSGNDIWFDYPDPSRRVITIPQEQSGFNVGQQGWYPVQVQNINDAALGSDSYRLALAVSTPGWSAALYEQDGWTLLKDDDSDGYLETGLLAPLETKTVMVFVESPANAVEGEETLVTLTATSEADGAKQAVSQIRSVVPAPFVQIFRSDQLYLDFLAPGFAYLNAGDPLITGGVNSFAVAPAAGPFYLAAWSKTLTGSGGAYTNIEYMLHDDFGMWQFTPAKTLTDNNGTTIRDRDPALATAGNGNIAVAWLREEDCSDSGQVGKKYNIYLAILHPDGTPGVLGLTNVTNSSFCSISGQVDYMTLQNLRLVEAGGNFHLAWVEEHYLYQVPLFSRDIKRSVYSATGGLVRAPAYLFSYNAFDNKDYRRIAIASVSLAGIGQKVMVTYSYEAGGGTSLVYSLLDVEDGDLYPVNLQDWTTLQPINAFDIDLVQLTGGRIVVVYIDSASSQPAFLVLEDDLNLLTPTAVSLDAPDGRRSGTVSVSGDSQGYAIITWLDGFASQRLYYALVNPGDLGNLLVTTPMVFRYVTSPSSIATNQGQGNASLLPRFRTIFPIIRR